jgi:hypothetical protein
MAKNAGRMLCEFHARWQVEMVYSEGHIIEAIPDVLKTDAQAYRAGA